MKHRLMDLLACPIDKSWPLKLEITQEVKEDEIISLPLENPDTGVICGFFCNFKQFMLVTVDGKGEEAAKSITQIKEYVNLDDCKQCFQIDILNGKIFCSEDKNHEYAIKEGIPVMLSKEKIEEIYGKRKSKNKK
ncbi:MAG: hypothetical protein GOP50_04200 [Candidatus Heimdallarchaeota archaeon]|nr:hypothetical protein [Candidatus Heimdallarchaeota archaeon]